MLVAVHINKSGDVVSRETYATLSERVGASAPHTFRRCAGCGGVVVSESHAQQKRVIRRPVGSIG